MPISDAVVQALIRNDANYTDPFAPEHAGWAWELRVMTAQTAIATLRSVESGGHETFRARAVRLSQPYDVPARVLALASGPLPVTSMLVSAQTRATLGMAGDADELVVTDGNHRMLALAYRAAWGWPLPSCIGVFVR